MKTLISILLAVLFLGSESSEIIQLNQLPVPYFMVGQDKDAYQMGLQKIDGNQVGYIRSLPSYTEGFGGFAQYFRADNYRNKRIRFSARFKYRNVSNYFSVYLRVDGQQFPPSLAFDNMRKRRLKGNSDWTRKYIILEVPEEAQRIQFGTFISGTGEAWVDDFRFEEADPREGVTDFTSGRIPTFSSTAKKVTIPDDMPFEPRNLDFEEH